MSIISEDLERNVFKQLPQPVLDLICSGLSEESTCDINDTIIDNGSIAKYFYFVKKGSCIVEFTKDKLVYKEPMLAGQVFGF
jgi:hypothetical protein